MADKKKLNNKKIAEANATMVSSLENLLDSYKQQKKSFQDIGLVGMAVTMDAHIKMTDQARLYLESLVSNLEKSTG